MARGASHPHVSIYHHYIFVLTCHRLASKVGDDDIAGNHQLLLINLSIVYFIHTWSHCTVLRVPAKVVGVCLFVPFICLQTNKRLERSTRLGEVFRLRQCWVLERVSAQVWLWFAVNLLNLFPLQLLIGTVSRYIHVMHMIRKVIKE